MYFLFSGEGPTDLGLGTSAALISHGSEYLPGPMTIITDQIIEARHNYSPLESSCCGYVSEYSIVEGETELKVAKKRIQLPGKKRAKETRYFYANARILARIALVKSAELNDKVVAILFRDADGTASAGRGLWRDKRQAMLDGFAEEGFASGVPMIPKPKSEAWLICALKANPYHACHTLEQRSGNDASPNSLKKELVALLDAPPTRENLCQLVQERRVDFERLSMPSFSAYRNRLEEVM